MFDFDKTSWHKSICPCEPSGTGRSYLLWLGRRWHRRKLEVGASTPNRKTSFKRNYGYFTYCNCLIRSNFPVYFLRFLVQNHWILAPAGLLGTYRARAVQSSVRREMTVAWPRLSLMDIDLNEIGISQSNTWGFFTSQDGFFFLLKTGWYKFGTWALYHGSGLMKRVLSVARL